MKISKTTVRNYEIYDSDDIELKDGSRKKEYKVVFETDSKELKDEIEKFFQCLMDRKDGN